MPKQWRKGQALVEFSFVLVLLLLPLTFIGIDWGIYLHRQSVLNTVVTDVARQAITWRGWVDETTRQERIATTRAMVKNNVEQLIPADQIPDLEAKTEVWVEFSGSSSDSANLLIINVNNCEYQAVARTFSFVPEFNQARVVMSLFNERPYYL